MSHLMSGNQDFTGREDAVSQLSFASDSSFPEALLAKLHDFRHVPGEISLHAEMLPPYIHQAEHHISGKDSPSIASLRIDNTSETMLDALPSEEEGDATSAFLHASRVLHAHPGLVMEHYDPATSVHTFKIAYPRRQQDEYPQSPSPTPSLSNGSSSSSPLTPFMQTPTSGPFHGFGSVSSLNSVLRLDPPLRRTTSELSQRPPPSLQSRYTPRRPNQVATASTPSVSSHPSPGAYSSAAERLTRRLANHVAGASLEAGITSSASNSYSYLSNAPQSRGDSCMSSNELLAFRESLVRRTEDVVTEAHILSDPNGYPGSSDSREDTASDVSEYGDSIPSDPRFSLHEPHKIRGGAGHPYNPLHPDTNLDGTFMTSDLLGALSIIRGERERVSSDDDSMLTNGDTLLDLYARSSTPTSQCQSESPIHDDPHTSRASASFGEVQGFLPDFLDFGPNVGLLRPVTDDLSSSGSSCSHFLAHDERLAPVPEGSVADPSREYNSMRLESDWVTPVPPGTHLGPRRAKSVAEFAFGRSRPTRPIQSYSEPWNTHSDLQPSDTEGRRAYHQVAPPRATISAEVTRGGEARRGCDYGTWVPEHAELGCNQSTAAPDDSQRGDSYNAKRVQDLRIGDDRRRKPALRIVLDSRSPCGSPSREFRPMFQPQQAMTLQEAAVSGPPTAYRLHRSATVTSPAPSKSSSHTGRRYRTLSDRAYRHPDVPSSPLFSDLVDDRQVSSPETRNTPLVRPQGLSAGEVKSRNASPHKSSGHVRNESCPVRERPAKAYVHRFGSSPDLRCRGSLTVGPPSSCQGVGLSLFDNGAFEAPRPAPEPHAHTNDRASTPPHTKQRGALAAFKKIATPASYLAVGTSPTGFGALSFRRHIHVWSKKQKQEEPRSDGPIDHLHSAGNPESASFISLADRYVRPQRRGLSFRKKTV